MKKTIVMALLSLLAVAFISCSNETNNPDNKNPVLKSAQNPPAIISYSCVGECSTGGSCDMEWDLTTHKIKCLCEGCAMSFEIDNPSDRSTASRANASEIMEGLSDHMQVTHHTTEYRITGIVQTISDLAEVFEILYTVDGVAYSVMIVYEFDTTDALVPKKKILIDCSGSCANSPGNCVVEYDLITSKVKCACEDDNCTMTVSNL